MDDKKIINETRLSIIELVKNERLVIGFVEVTYEIK